jgi:ribosomal-protein-alanine N-acetyltransferase
VGTMTLQSIIRGAFQSCSVGYWLVESAQGRASPPGLSVRRCRWPSGTSGCTGQAETLTQNRRSQRVLERLGFVQYGHADSYMHIAGEWQANLLYQLITPTPERVKVG